MPAAALDASFAAEHASLNQILLEVMACDDLINLINGFDSLEPVLLRHIEHEEAAGGPLAYLERLGSFSGIVTRIRGDHTAFMAGITTLRHEAREFLTDDLCGDHLPHQIVQMRTRILSFADTLLTHEKFETQVYLSAASMRRHRGG